MYCWHDRCDLTKEKKTIAVLPRILDFLPVIRCYLGCNPAVTISHMNIIRMKNKEKPDTCGTLCSHIRVWTSYYWHTNSSAERSKTCKWKDGEPTWWRTRRRWREEPKGAVVADDREHWSYAESEATVVPSPLQGVGIEHTCFLNHSYTFLVKHNLLNVCI